MIFPSYFVKKYFFIKIAQINCEIMAIVQKEKGTFLNEKAVVAE